MQKNQKAYEFLKEQFLQRKIKKTYLALVAGNIKDDEGEIDLAIGRSKKDFRRRVSLGKQTGKIREALTLYKVKKRFQEYTLLEVYPKTGRTHQIRSHLKAIGYPIVCDKLYGPRRGAQCPFGLERQFLHAMSLELNLPNGSRIKLEADLPADLEGILKELNSH